MRAIACGSSSPLVLPLKLSFLVNTLPHTIGITMGYFGQYLFNVFALDTSILVPDFSSTGHIIARRFINLPHLQQAINQEMKVTFNTIPQEKIVRTQPKYAEVSNTDNSDNIVNHRLKKYPHFLKLR